MIVSFGGLVAATGRALLVWFTGSGAVTVSTTAYRATWAGGPVYRATWKG
ncbi:MAG: hypothetical protein IT352_07465 [Gemmatimonadales bacterium]|nr:hypothetical protein [Gemmatimonadales bacterium]